MLKSPPSLADFAVHRRVSVLPHNLQGVVGMHDGFPVEKLAVSGDKTYLGSCSHDKLLKFWRIDEMKPVQPDEIPAFGVADADGVAAAAAAEEFSDDDDEGTDPDANDRTALPTPHPLPTPLCHPSFLLFLLRSFFPFQLWQSPLPCFMPVPPSQ